MVALKKNVLLRDKTKDVSLRLLFPHISESNNYKYLIAISKGFSDLSILVALTFFLVQQLKEITVNNSLSHFFVLYYINADSLPLFT
jgi:hypothetical protein